MVWDEARGEIVLHGGDDLAQVFQDTWTWNGLGWTQKNTVPTDPARTYHSMAFDAVRERVVLIGGQDASVLSTQTFEWDGVGWASRPTTRSCLSST